uniref:PPIase cyclophilin-type domain-containing protein n=1 Tax=Pseudictyota dubia TaxID=2749911 RepID=A0A7R9WBJ0_9STRA|mmetsp:Transcript_41290/g.76297  ORF Transcript_41290/g.76297 Transcript_41290/m.76297 type:complete len:105 (+) Transcript_41290:340-654(+)
MSTTSAGCSVWRTKDQERTDHNFFITYERQTHLNNVYTVFGRMLDGWDVLDQMERLPVVGGTKKSVANRPVNPPIIKGVTIHANPLADEGIVYPSKNGPPEKVQ